MKKMILMTAVLSMVTLSACSKKDAPKDTKETQSSTSIQSETSPKEERKDATPKIKVIDEKEAIEKYKEQFPNTDVISVEYQQKMNTEIYEIEGVDDEKEYKLSIDKNTGKSVEDRSENLDAEDANGVKRAKDKLEGVEMKPASEIIKIATKEIADSEVKEWKLEKDDGVVIYDVTTYTTTEKYELKINAITGEIINKEKDD